MPRLPFSVISAQFQHDFNQAYRFLHSLDPNAKDFLFVAVHYEQHRVPQISRQPLTKRVFESLADWNKLGWNIFVTVNATVAGTSRTKADITRIRTIFIDDDGKVAAKPYPLEPSYTIETSPGKKQVYWFLADEKIDVDEWDAVQQTLVNDYGGDPNARDVARILRIPGFYNTKPEYSTPPQCSILSAGEGVYPWADITKAFPPSQVISAVGKVKGEALDVKKTMEMFMSGDNYHQAGISLAGWFYNKGLKSSPDLTAVLQTLMDTQCDFNDPRFYQRREQDIPASVAWVIKERKKEEPPQVTDIFRNVDNSKQYTALPMPGGGMHRIVEWVKGLMRYPNETIAIIVAEHLVSVFGGGHYHIWGNTTTRKRIMLAPLGSGKNTITRAIGKLVQAMGQLSNEGMPWVLEPHRFIGSDSFSFSVQHKQIEEHRVRSFLVNEAGESGKSGAGDIDNLRAYQLQALSTKADEVFMPKKFSEQGKNGADKQMNDVYGGVWVYLHESTIKSYANLLQSSDAFANGDLSRSDIFFVKPYILARNEICTEIPHDILVLFSNLAKDFRALPGGKGIEDHKVWALVDISAIEQDLLHLETEIIDARNKAFQGNNEVLIALLARRFERILTSILICALADAANNTTMARPIATLNHLRYAIQRATAIDETVIFHSSHGGALSDSQFAKAEDQFKEKFKTLVQDPPKAKKQFMRSEVSQCGIYKGIACWVMNFSAFNRQLQRGAFPEMVRTTFRDDMTRARNSFLEHLEALDIVSAVMVPTNEPGEFKRVKNSWWLNPHHFPVKPHTKK